MPVRGGRPFDDRVRSTRRGIIDAGAAPRTGPGVFRLVARVTVVLQPLHISNTDRLFTSSSPDQSSSSEPDDKRSAGKDVGSRT